MGGKTASLALLWGHGRSAEAAAAGAGVRRPAICSLVRVHLFKLLSSPSFGEASEGEAEHEEETEIKEQELVGSSRMKGTQEDEEAGSKSDSLLFPPGLSGAFSSCCLIEWRI